MSDSDSVFSGDSPLQRADRAKFSLFRKQRTALRAGSFGWGCRHHILLAARILLDFVRRKICLRFPGSRDGTQTQIKRRNQEG